MNTLYDWHGDIEEFIEAKQIEEKKVWALIAQGYDGSFNGPAYGSAMYQNENLSVRATDEFMNAAIEGLDWKTRAVNGGEILETKNASHLLYKIAEGTWICGDRVSSLTQRFKNGIRAKAATLFAPVIPVPSICS
jgi:ribonucleoside-diphosphate reductase alpha chain